MKNVEAVIDRKDTVVPFQVTLQESGTQFWETYCDCFRGIIIDAFEPDFDDFLLDQIYFTVQNDCSYPGNRIFLLEDKQNIVGFTVWYPYELHNDDHFEPFRMVDAYKNMDAQELTKRTVGVTCTAIRPTHRHKGGWTMLMNRLDEDVLHEGFHFMIRYVRKANDYSNKIKKRYGEHIIAEEKYYGWGEQMKYWIVLGDSSELPHLTNPH